MSIIKNVRSVFPIPKDWERDSDRKAFAIRIETSLRELFTKVSGLRNLRIKAGSSEVTPDQDGIIQLGTAATRSVQNNLTTTASGSVLDARQGKALKDALDGKIDLVQLTSVASNGSRQYTVNNTGKFLLACFGASTSKNLFLVNVANGTPTVMAFASSSTSVLSITTSANTLTLSNTGNNGAQVFALVMSGTISDKT